MNHLNCGRDISVLYYICAEHFVHSIIINTTLVPPEREGGRLTQYMQNLTLYLVGHVAE